MADWGADVIKVEPPAGDPMRKMFGAIGVERERVPPYEVDNRGKRCVVIDVQTDEGRADLEALLATADVFLTNLRPDALERLGLGAADLMARHPRVVYANVTGYGMEGDERDRAGYDIGAFWARSSLAHRMVPPGELPPALRSGMGDHITGVTMLSGILAALLEREKTGRGRHVHTSLLRTGIYCNAWDISIQQTFGRLASVKPRTVHTAPLLNCYAASDGRGFWLLGLEQDRHWPGFLRAIDREDLQDDPRFANAVTRAKNPEVVIATLDAHFATRTYAEWTASFDAHDVWWAPINSIPDVLVDPQAAAAGAWTTVPGDEGEEPYASVAGPVAFEGFDQRPGRVHRLGEDTDAVLREVGRR